MHGIGEIQYRLARKRFARTYILKDGTKKVYEYYLPYKIPYIWAACENCGEYRWVQVEHKGPRHRLCQKCGTQGHLAELGRFTRFPKSNTIKIKETRPRIYCRTHPYAQVDGRVLISRIVMERHLGRYLLPEEVVHHSDGNHYNDDINNLMLFPSSKEHMRHHYKLRMQAISAAESSGLEIQEGLGSLLAPGSKGI